MPRKPRDPDNPVTGKTVTVKLPEAFYDWLEQSAEQRGVKRAELARELLERGRMHLAVETGPVTGNVEDDRPLLEQRVEYAALRLEEVLMTHAPADPAGAVVAARGVARSFAQWADERALNANLLLPAMERSDS